jgi:RNA-directed DNA polymerase
MQRIGYLYEQVIDFANLYTAFYQALRGSGNKTSGHKFFYNLENELVILKKELAERTYTPQAYRYFKTYDPKEREIAVAPFRDRIIHHAIVKVIEPLYERVFIFDSYATRKNKGTHKAIKKAQQYLKANNWYLKMDVKKFFDSIDHQIMLRIIEQKIKDSSLLELIAKIIKNGGKNGKGLPIGNLTSQFFANVYLDRLDHYVKDKLAVKYYLRYMDDSLIFSNNKEYLKEYRKKMEIFLKKELELELKEAATFINSRLNGLSFLGTRIFPNLIRIRTENLKRTIKKMKNRQYKYKNGFISEEKYLQSMQSMIGYLRNSNSYHLRRNILGQLS